MSWVILGFIATFIFAIANFFDKYILEKRLSLPSPLTYLAMSGLVGMVITLFLAGMASNELATVRSGNNILAFVAGLLFTGGMGLYFRALTVAETSLTGSLFQLSIIGNAILGYLFLSENPGGIALAGMGLLLVASFFLSHQIDEDGRRSFHKQAFVLMALASVLVSGSDVLFKLSVVENGSFIISQTFEYAAWGSVGIALFVTNRRIRREIATALQHHPVLICGIILGNELLVFAGTILSRLSLVHLDIAVAQAIMGIQPLFLVLLGYLLTKLWPHRIHENVLRRHLAIKLGMAALIVVAEIVIVVGSLNA